MQRKSRIQSCAVKNNLRSGIDTFRNALDLNCHFYVVEATLENKCMCFQDYDYIVQRAPSRCITRRLLADLENELNRSKQQEERIRRPDTVWLLKWREVNRILKEHIFIYGSVSFSFFRRRLKSTEWPWASLLKIGLYHRQPLLFLFYFSGGLGMLSFREF